MGKQVIQNYIFSTGASTITLSDFTTLHTERLALITDTTTNQILYNFADSSVATANTSGNVITLSQLPGGVSSSDRLRIDYDCLPADPIYATTVMSGNIASGSADSGDPVKVGGIYHSAAPTLSDGQRGDLQVDSSGRLITNIAPLTGATDSIAINDGTNGANVLAGGSTPAGLNALITTGTAYTTGTISLSSSTTATSWYDMANYAWISLEVLTNSSAATLTFQTSGDASETNITSTGMQQPNNNATLTTTTATGGVFHGPRTGRYFRISTNLSSSNTATLVLTFYAYASALSVQNSAQSGTWNVGLAASTTGGYSYAHYTSAQTATSIKGSAGTLHAIIVNTPVASGTIEYDDATSHTNAIGIITYPSTLSSDGPHEVLLDVAFSTGLNITTTGTMDLTFLYK
jgi:hypothetical protein